MKKILILFLVLVLVLTKTKAQSVNGIPISDIDVEYVQIVGTSKLFSTKLTIQIDFGQDTKYFKAASETLVKDVNGKEMIFNSMIDALNFMSKNGFDFVSSYAITVANQNVYHFLLRKSKR